MDNITLNLRAMELSLSEIIKFYNDAKNVFAEVNKMTQSDSDEYDFTDFDMDGVFCKVEKEDLNEYDKIESHAKLIKAEMIMQNIYKSLIEDRNRLHDEYVAKLKFITHEIKATSCIQSFLKSWDSKVLDDHKIEEYPVMFQKYFEKIPINKRTEIGEIISDIKAVDWITNTKNKNILNESKRFNCFNLDDVSKNSRNIYESEISFGSSLSKNSLKKTIYADNTLAAFPDYHIKEMPKSKSNQQPNLGVSLIDYTINRGTGRSSLFSIESKSMDSTICRNLESELSFDGEENDRAVDLPDCHDNSQDQLDNSTSGNEESILNKAIHISKEVGEFPSFLDDSARIPDIEKRVPWDIDESELHDPFDRSLENSHEYNSIRDNSVQMQDNESVYNRSLFHEDQDDADVSRPLMDLSASGLENISFNNSAMGNEVFLNTGRKK